MSTAAVVVREVVGSLQRKQSAHVANLLALSFDKSGADSPFMDNNRAIETACRTFCAGLVGAYHEIVAAILNAKRLVGEGKFSVAYEEYISGFIKFLEVFREESSWLVPWLHVFVYDARKLAMHADAEASKKRDGEVHDNVKNAEQHLKRAFSMTVNDRAPVELSKRPGTLYIVNQLFKIYFHLNAINLCRNLIRAVELQSFDQFDKRDQVTYKYYLGRIFMFQDQYHQAEASLSYAWRHCHKKYSRNKRRILQFLVPVKLILGVMPSAQLIETYNLTEFQGISKALQQGNIREFNQSLERYQDQFVQQGVYLLMEKLRAIVMRNLLKKVYVIRTKKNQLKLVDFQTAVDFADSAELDMDALESLVANLIFKGYVKGYISHKLKILVLSKSNPFPPITDVLQDPTAA
ncbi:hypothetical protein H310_03472 [Aphanomyces invadans]|uniref:PCI domain-containing protein n=1 Tax=Aphanomyces invadans TaxID=157072 RepID=A0A024UJI8_9STRA|nr:hypothetical protein H310_03472 [Aphanomyces invadans]ETW05788.1 hypothetical protein H310_03472 [Aphanomyces invadans]|eukprot:XP_008865565.1 hypothetical protein H310_03472 [Aphanomyces invadans]